MTRRIHPAANKHGVNDDIRHAIRYQRATADIGDAVDDNVLYIGPDLAGNLIEVIERSGLVVHAMPLRKKYEPLLRHFREHDD